MIEKELSPQEKERLFNSWLVSEYLKYGSVDEVYKVHKYEIPMSYPSYQRLLNRWGIVKAAGPNSKLTEALEFLTRFAQENVPLESLYKRMPPSFRTSVSTMHRILGYIKEGITRRLGTALVITREAREREVLIAHDVSTPRVELGKHFNSLSIPMGFSRKRDAREEAILRVMQQEVFASDAVNRTFPDNVIPDYPRPFMFLDVVDVRVEVFNIVLTEEDLKKRNFTSFKLKDYEFMQIDAVVKKGAGNSNFRAGVYEAVKGYDRYLDLKKRDYSVNPFYEKSHLNQEIALALEQS